MHLHHERELDAPIARVWVRAQDVREVARAFPGAEAEQQADGGFTGRLIVGVGPVKLVYDGVGRYEEVDDAAHRAVIVSRGSQRHGPGRADLRVTLDLDEIDPNRTRATLETELTVNGSPVNVGGGIAEKIATPLVNVFLDRLGAEDPDDEGQGVAGMLRRLRGAR